MFKQVGGLADGSLVQVYTAAAAASLTGVIRIDADTNRGRETLLVGVAHGHVLQVDSPTRADAQRLGQLAVRGELCSEADVSSALAQAQAQQRPLGDILVEHRRLTPAQLAELLTLQFKDDLHRSLAWRDGEYRVGSQNVGPRPRGISLSLESSAQMGHWQGDQWPALRIFVPTNSTSFQKAFRGPLPGKMIEAGQLGEQERQIFSLVGPTRKVSDLVPLARIETFEVCRSLGLLCQAGAINMASAGEVSSVTAVKAGPLAATAFSGLVRHVATAAVICLAVGLGLTVWLSNQGQPDAPLSVGAVNSWHDGLTKNQMARVRNALGVYRARHGSYPARLNLLSEEGLLASEDFVYPFFENPYTYRSYDNQFMLVRPKR